MDKPTLRSAATVPGISGNLLLQQKDLPATPNVEAVIDRLFPSRRIQRVLLVNPPDTSSEVFMIGTAKRRRYTNYPPYGLAILAETLRLLDVEVRILNLNHTVIKSAVMQREEEFDFDRTWRTALADAL